MSDKDLPPAVEKMLAWRKRNGLAQKQAFQAMHKFGFPITPTTYQKWENGERKPTRITALALDAILETHPTVNSAAHDA